MNDAKKLAVDLVIPIYNEEKVLPELTSRLRNVMERQPGIQWRVLMINDGSRDGTGHHLNRLSDEDPRFVPIELTRNFGHQAAISAGLDACTADAVIFLDADLQDPPEKIPEMLDLWQKGADIVRGERLSRSETGMRRIGFDLFHRFFNRFSDYPVPPHSGTFSLLDRFAYESLRTLPERHRFFPGLCAWIGYDQHVVTYHREERSAGQPKQTLSRLIRYSLDALFSFSYAPIRLMIYAGTLISLVGFSVGIYFIVKRLIGVETAFTGFTTLIVTILALGGLQLMALGVIGEYLARVYDETKGRPYYIVHPRQSVEKKSGSAPDA